MKILVLGGEGFLGRHVAQVASELGHDVTSYDLAGFPPVDVLAMTPDMVNGFDRIFHLAGRLGTHETFADPQGTVRTNILGTLNVLQCALKHRIPLTYVTLGNDWLNPYTITKNAASRFCAMYHQYYGLPVQVAVTYNCFGPGQKCFPVRKIIPQFMYCLLKRQPVDLNAGGRQVVDLVYAPDLARALLENDRPGTRHYGTAEPITVKKTALLCAEALGISNPDIRDTPPRPGEPLESRSLAPYPMNIRTPLSESLRLTAEWYRRNIDSANLGAPPRGTLEV
jgi:UDP-glucose 4-epimerase